MNKIIRKAFTLIELLVVIAIIGILSGLIVVSMGGMTQKATIAKAQVFSNSLRNSLMMNIIGEWKFDGPTSDGVSATTNDVLDTWSGNNGSIPASTNNPTVKTGSNCLNGSCLSFDGNDYILISSGPTLNYNPITISLWVKEPASAYGTFIIGKSTYGAYLRNNGSGEYAWDLHDTVEHNITTSMGALNYWHNVVGSYDGVTQKLYVDGVLKSFQSLAITPVVTTDLGIGACFFCGPSQFTVGLIDEVRIYSAAIPASQIKEQYYAGLNSLLVNGSIDAIEYSERINSIAER